MIKAQIHEPYIKELFELKSCVGMQEVELANSPIHRMFHPKKQAEAGLQILIFTLSEQKKVIILFQNVLFFRVGSGLPKETSGSRAALQRLPYATSD